MGSVLKGFIALVTVVVVIATPLQSIILATISKDFEQFVSDQFEVVFAWFGIEDEDVVTTNVHDQLLFSEDTTVQEMLTQVAIAHSKTGEGIMELITKNSNRIRGSYTNYFNNGVNKYSHGLPTTNLRAHSIPVDEVKTIIEAEVGSPITILDTARKVPTKEEWVYSHLYTDYGYDSAENEMLYTGKVYSVYSIEYNYTTNEYDIVIGRRSTIITTTTVTVVPLNATEDTVSTNVLVERALSDEPNIVESDTTTDQVVPTGTVSPSVTVENSTDNQYEAVTLNYISAVPVHHYVIEYTITGDDINFWIYEIGSGSHTTLDEASAYITNLEMLPVVSLRNNSVSITSDKESPEYLETKDILRTIGLDPDVLVESIEESEDIDDIVSAHIHFGVDPTVEDPIIAKALFYTFDYIYEDSSLYNADISSYLVTMQEGQYNASLTWKTFDRSIVAGSIGPLGTCTNTVDGSVTDSALVLRKQTAPEFYTEYRITYLASSTFITNGAFSNTNTGTLEAGALTIPISKFFINQLTGLEQMDLFSKSLRLAVYAIDVQHLRYYQTAAFASAIKIVMIIVTIIIFIFTWYTGGATAQAFWIAAKQVLIALAISYAFTKLLESTDNAALQALYTIAAVAAMVYSGQVDGLLNTAFLSANMLTAAVQVHTMQGYERLEDRRTVFSKGLEDRQASFDEERAAQDAGLGIDTVTGLSRVEPNKGYIEGIDSFMFRAKGQVQYQYQTLFDYDRPFDIYDNAFRLDLNKNLS
jgi:hypothetical protein